MKVIIFACLLAVAIADTRYAAPGPRSSPSGSDEIAILRDDRHHGDDGSFSQDTETANGIRISHSGARLQHVDEQPVGHQGKVQFTLPDGQEFDLKFVADENGYQPESSWLPVAPEFPHPIPQFVLDQIEKAAREDAEQERSAPAGAGRGGYA